MDAKIDTSCGIVTFEDPEGNLMGHLKTLEVWLSLHVTSEVCSGCCVNSISYGNVHHDPKQNQVS